MNAQDLQAALVNLFETLADARDEIDGDDDEITMADHLRDIASDFEGVVKAPSSAWAEALCQTKEYVDRLKASAGAVVGAVGALDRWTQVKPLAASVAGYARIGSELQSLLSTLPVSGEASLPHPQLRGLWRSFADEAQKPVAALPAGNSVGTTKDWERDVYRVEDELRELSKFVHGEEPLVNQGRTLLLMGDAGHALVPNALGEHSGGVLDPLTPLRRGHGPGFRLRGQRVARETAIELPLHELVGKDEQQP